MKRRDSRLLRYAVPGVMALGAILIPADIRAVTPEVISPLPAGDLKRAEVMIDNANYTGALDQLRSIDTSALADAERQEVAFLIAQTAFMRGDANCVTLLEQYVADYPASIRTMTARMLAADYYFFTHDYAEALTRYRALDLAQLDPAVRREYTYRMALSEIKRGYFAEARRRLESLQGTKRFGIAADYYLAYLDYIEGNYEAAYKAFEAIPETDKSTYSRRGAVRDYVTDGIEPAYYMTQIEFLRGDYDSVIRHGRSLLEKKPVEDLIPETWRVVGESYFRTDNPGAARGYLERYVEAADTPNASGVYTLGSILYDEGDYEKAAALFSTLTDEPNEIAQGAWLYLGQCAVHDGDNSAAAMAFEKAYRLGYDDKISEKALFNYATALLRGGQVPFSRSATLLEEYLRRFPRSEHASEVRATLAEAYCRQGDYAKALDFISGINDRSAATLALRQQILFQLGVEEQSNGKSASAATHLREAADMTTSDKTIAAQARLWLGDALYSQKKYAEASKAYEAFLKNGRSTQNYDLGVYDLAYSLYRQDRFAQAVPYFTQAAQASGLTAAQRANARLRKADCLFYSRDYKGARATYEEVIAAGDVDADYATLRHATILGLLGDIDGKLRELRNLSKKYPGTSWDAASLLEQASTLNEQGDVSGARTVYEDLTSRHKDRAEARVGQLRLAQTYRAQGDTDRAIDEYEKVIEQWPSSDEALSAHQELTGLHASRGNLQDYADWLGDISGAPRISIDEMEQLEFDAAEDAFAANVANYAMLERYVDRYPDGAHLARALFDIADGRTEAGNYKGAIEAVDLLLKRRPDASAVDAALMLKAEVLEDYHPVTDWQTEAYKTYARVADKGNTDFLIAATAGMMRTAKTADEQVALARKVSAMGGDSELMEQASYYEANGLLDSGHQKEGVALLTTLSANPMSEYGARAAVLLGEWQYRHKQYSAAEKTLIKFTDSGSPHNYWLARGFITLADVYTAQGKKYLAKEYLESLRENYPGDEDDIRQMISSRLK